MKAPTVTTADLDEAVKSALERHGPRTPGAWSEWARAWLARSERSVGAARAAYDATEDLLCAECAAASLAVVAYLDAKKLPRGPERKKGLDFARRACALAKGVVL